MSSTRLNGVLYEGHEELLNRLTQDLGLRNQSATLNDAIVFRARFAKREIVEISTALQVLDELRRLQSSGHTLVAERPDGSERKQIILLGLQNT